MHQISPLASVSPGAVLGRDVRIGPFVIVESGTTLGDGCVIDSGAVIKTGTRLGARVRVDHGAVLGGLPQDYSFDPSVVTGVVIGDDTIIRENVTVNRATKPGTDTVVGSGCMLMANSHVAHDCVVGDKVVIANGGLLAGHARIGSHVFISGNTAVHQFCVVGESAMCAGLSAITDNVPPFGMAVERNRLAGLNVVGMRRRGLSRAAITEVRAAYRAVYLSRDLNLRDNARAALESGAFFTPEGRGFLEFFLAEGRRHNFARPRRVGEREASEPVAAL